MKPYEITNMSKKEIEEMYLDYVNNFVSVTIFADFYSITEDVANDIIKAGRKINNSK